MSSFYSETELATVGLKSYGKHVLISKKCSLYSPQNIVIGDNVRIDDFCILSGTITIGSHVHIAAYCVLYGAFGIEIQDYSGLSARCTLYSQSDDFSGEFLVGAQFNENQRNVQKGKIIIERFCQIGANSVLLPEITIHEGVAVGAMSLVRTSLDSWTIYAGIPARKIKERSKSMLHLL